MFLSNMPQIKRHSFQHLSNNSHHAFDIWMKLTPSGVLKVDRRGEHPKENMSRLSITFDLIRPTGHVGLTQPITIVSSPDLVIYRYLLYLRANSERYKYCYQQRLIVSWARDCRAWIIFRILITESEVNSPHVLCCFIYMLICLNIYILTLLGLACTWQIIHSSYSEEGLLYYLNIDCTATMTMTCFCHSDDIYLTASTAVKILQRLVFITGLYCCKARLV